MGAFTLRGKPAASPVLFAFQPRIFPWRPHLAQALWRAEPTFRRVIRQCDAIMQPMLGWSVEQELCQPPEQSHFHDRELLATPTLMALTIAQLELWRARGLGPNAVMGLSAGEFLAAYAAGVLTLQDTLKLICYLDHVLGTRRVALGAQVKAELDWEHSIQLEQALNTACFATVEWAPAQTVFAGETQAIELLMTHLGKNDISYQRMQTQFILHAQQGASSLQEWTDALRDLAPGPPQIPIYSALTGGLTCETRFDAQHWWRVVFAPAYGARTLRRALQAGYTHVLEVGLTSNPVYPTQEIANAAGISVQIVPSLPSLLAKEMPFARPTTRTRLMNSLKRKLPPCLQRVMGV